MVGEGFQVRRLSGSIGAEILGIDLASEASDNAIGEIRKIWLEHNVVFFRDQDLPPAKFLAFAKRFGEVVEYPFIKGIDGFPEIIPVIKLEQETTNFGGIWHTDVTRTREDRVRDTGKAAAKKEYISEHPVVRTHPETGRKALYVNIGHTVRFKDMTEAESAPLLNFLFEHQTKPEFTCRFNWRVGSLAFWDNRCALHNPVNDYHGFRRVMHRVTLAGDKPR
jgi:taurine dioxygenase